MIVYLGSNELKKVYLGNTEIKKIYVGDNLVFPRSLPTTYQAVSYIQSSWSQYIRTSIIANNNYWYYLKVSSQDVYDDLVYFGSSNWSQSVEARFVVWNANNQAYVSWNEKNFVNISANTIYEYEWNYKNSRAIKFNWSIIKSNISTLNSQGSLWIAIFAWNYDTRWILFQSSIRLYSLKISNWSVIAHDFVPCYRKSDNVIGLFDIIEQKFYTNSWSWSFTKGPNI